MSSRNVLGNLIGAPRAALLRALAPGERSVGELVQLTGLSQPNISNHLSRLRQQGLVRSRRDGRKIYYSLTDDQVQNLLCDAPPSGDAPDPSAVYAAFLDALYDWEVDKAGRIILRAWECGASWKTLYMDVLLPALRQVGRWWEAGEITIGHEHTATALTERLMARLCANGQFEPREKGEGEDGRCAVLGCVPGEQHSIATRMTADFLEHEGWRIVYLGANVPSAEFIRAAERHGALAVILSVTLKECEAAALETTRALKAAFRETPIRILVGGKPVLESPETYLRAGADVVARDPAHTVACLNVWADPSPDR